MFIDTHTHLDGDEFATDRAEVMARAREAGVCKVFLPAIDIKSTEAILDNIINGKAAVMGIIRARSAKK